MKELSIEQKAQAYDGVREKIAIRFGSNVAEEIFSEYEESEDERIRKRIIHALHGDVLEMSEIKEAVDWLEKQGEQNPYGQRQECIDCQFNYAGECKGSCAMKRSEQKPADTEKGAKGNDKEIPISEPPLTIKHAREVMGIKQDTAWSELDDVKINRIVACLENLNVADNDILLKDVAWLKYLKERYTWKPSDEQMRVLDLAIRCGINRGTTEETTLVSLFNDLKKLK